MMHGMTLLGRLLFPGLLAIAGAVDASPATPAWNHVEVPALKTSIYVGGVTLITSAFERAGDGLAATYEARVFPWFFWSETGDIHITVTDEAWQKLARGERCEFTGAARNHRGKPRRVSGYADPAAARTGKIKVRIAVDGMELIFNGPYTLDTVSVQASSAQ